MHTQYSTNPTVSSNLNQSKEKRLILDRLNVHTDAMVTVSDRTERKVLTKVLVFAATRKFMTCSLCLCQTLTLDANNNKQEDVIPAVWCDSDGDVQPGNASFLNFSGINANNLF